MSDVRVSPRSARLRAFVFLLAIVAGAGTSVAQLSPVTPTSSTAAEDPAFSDPVMRRVVIFFPPTPPPLDRPVSHLVAPMPAQFTPPAELSFYVNEVFYAPLSTHLARSDLNPKLRQQLDAYRATRTSVQHELHAELARVRDAAPPVRQQALEALARKQAPALAELEKNAERLRDEMVTSEYNWSAGREWRLGEKGTRGDSPFEVSQVMRAYVYYHRGLLPAQRGLLREISIEMGLAAENTATATAAQPFFFFMPEPARVQLADDLPAALAAQVAEFQTKKSALKKELYDAVYEQERANFLRGNVLKSVAARQTARLATLEKLAEEIRRGLAELPPPVTPGARSPLPPVLTARIAALLQSRSALLKDTMARIDEIRRRAAGVAQINYNFDPSGLKFTVQPRRAFRDRPAGEIQQRIEAVSHEMSATAEDYGRHFAELANETDAIRRDVTESLGNAARPIVEDALSGAVRYAALQESNDAYRDYRTAVFEPGLSPEQRRLLFGSALLQLDLPLLRGELQPVYRGNW